jgi:four helix bundle protein
MDEGPTNCRSTFQSGENIRNRAFNFACKVVGLCEALEQGRRVGRLMVPQLLNCSLSFATMLEEARAAESDADFISKCTIGLKECRESWTRLRICEKCNIAPGAAVGPLVQESNELISILATIIRNKRRSVAAKRARRTLDANS